MLWSCSPGLQEVSLTWGGCKEEQNFCRLQLWEVVTKGVLHSVLVAVALWDGCQHCWITLPRVLLAAECGKGEVGLPLPLLVCCSSQEFSLHMR